MTGHEARREAPRVEGRCDAARATTGGLGWTNPHPPAELDAPAIEGAEARDCR